MRKVREVLRLHHVAGLSGRAIARSLKLSPVTVKRYIRRAEEAGLGWPLAESLDDAQLERRLLPGAPPIPGETRFPMPDWSQVHRELRRKGVTLALLWQEYKEAHPHREGEVDVLAVHHVDHEAQYPGVDHIAAHALASLSAITDQRLLAHVVVAGRASRDGRALA